MNRGGRLGSPFILKGKAVAEARIRVRVQPNASRDEIGCFEKGLLKIWVTAPPRKGEANDTLIALLAKN